ncbi:MAG: hypothetical protein NVSMB14_16540 [Isosphaeraceae bacterium]
MDTIKAIHELPEEQQEDAFHREIGERIEKVFSVEQEIEQLFHKRRAIYRELREMTDFDCGGLDCSMFPPASRLSTGEIAVYHYDENVNLNPILESHLIVAADHETAHIRSMKKINDAK